MTKVLGVDPGTTGGWALLAPSPSGWSAEVLGKWATSGLSGACDFLRTLDPKSTIVGYEIVSSSPLQRPKVAFTFGGNYGSWLTLFHVLGLTSMGFKPQTWQSKIPGIKELRLMHMSSDKKYRARKNLIKEWVKVMYPKARGITLDTADALAIAHHTTTILDQL